MKSRDRMIGHIVRHDALVQMIIKVTAEGMIDKGIYTKIHLYETDSEKCRYYYSYGTVKNIRLTKMEN